MEPIIKEKHSYLKPLLVTLALVILCTISYQGYLMYTRSQVKPAITIPTLTSYGLDGETDPNAIPLGNLYYTVTSEETPERDALPYIYRYTLEDNTSEQIAATPMKAYIPYTATTSLVLASVNTNYSNSSWQPHLYNTDTEAVTLLPNVSGLNVQDLTLSPDNTKYAYSYQPSEVPGESYNDINSWNIAVHTIGSDEVEVIEGGIEPGFGNGGTEVMYLTKEGINSYNLLTSETKQVFTEYTPYKKSDGLAVSADGTTIIFTKPSANLLSISHLDTNQATTSYVEKGRLVMGQTGYTKPIISPDGLFYGVISSTIEEIGKNTDGNYAVNLRNNFQIRQVISMNILKSINIINLPSTDYKNWSISSN